VKHGLGIKLDKLHAWHFVGETLRDGSPIPEDGVPLVYTGKMELCVSGLHFSRQPFDALKYAPGGTLCLVEVGGTVVEPEGENKGICSERTIIARMDATELLRHFSRMQALSVIPLWDAARDAFNELVYESFGVTP